MWVNSTVKEGANQITPPFTLRLATIQKPPARLSQETELRPDEWVKLHNGAEFIIELTSPWEENFSDVHERKVRKHSFIYNQRKLINRSTFLLVFEVGARGNSTTRV